EGMVGWQTSEVRGRRIYEVLDISPAEASLGWTRDRSGPAFAAKELQLRARDGHAVDCIVQGAAVRGDDGEVVQVLYALRRKAGTRGYADRLIDSIDGLASIHAAEPPEPRSGRLRAPVKRLWARRRASSPSRTATR